MGIALALLYTLIFLFLIRKMNFFRLPGLKPWTPSIFFLLKIAAGFALWAIYTFYYTDPSGADIYKYFSDGGIMYDALKHHPSDYFRMLSGIGNNTPHFDALYYQKMDHWYREFDSNLYNDSHTIIRFNALVMLFSFGYYHVHTVFMCFLSFAGLCGIYRAMAGAAGGLKKILAYGIFLFPSVLFWSSGVLKEGLLFFGLGLLFYQLIKWFEDFRLHRIFLMSGCLLLLFVTKFYIVVALFPALAGFMLIRFGTTRYAALKYLLVLVLYIAAGLQTPRILPGYDPLQVLTIKQHDMINLAKGGTYLNMGDTAVAWLDPKDHGLLLKTGEKTAHIRSGAHFRYYPARDFTDTTEVNNWQDTASMIIMTDYPPAGSFIETDRFEPTLSCFAKATPVAVFNALFRPFPWEARSLMLLAPAAENLLLPLLLLPVLFFLKRKNENGALIGFCIVFSLMLLAITGLTTPVMGALVRYKIPALPFLFAVLVLMTDEQKLFARFPRLSRWLKTEH